MSATFHSHEELRDPQFVDRVMVSHYGEPQPSQDTAYVPPVRGHLQGGMQYRPGYIPLQRDPANPGNFVQPPDPNIPQPPRDIRLNTNRPGNIPDPEHMA